MDQDKEMALKEILSVIDKYRVEDELFDTAYENISPHERSIIKKCVALNYKYLSYNFHDSFNQKVVEFKCEDFYLKKTVQKKEAAFVFLSKDIDSPAQVISLVLPPRILGIETYVLGLYEKWPESLLLCMELTGIYNVYTITRDLFYDIIKKPLFKWAYLFLGNGDSLGDNIIHLYPPKKGLIIRNPSKDKRIDTDQLSFLHPSLELEEETLDEGELEIEGFSVIYTEKDITIPNFFSKHPPLILGNGLEGLWMWDNITRETFFCNMCTVFSV